MNEVSAAQSAGTLGGVCGLRAEGWKDEAVRIATLLYDGLRFGASAFAV